MFSCQKQEDKLSICFTGDVLLDRGVRKEIEKHNTPHLFENVSNLFFQHDAVVINLECPVTNKISPINKQYIFRAEPNWILPLQKSGITHAAMANNHTNDQGREGMIDTYNNLIKSNITPIGFGSDQKEACKPVFISKGDIHVALFNSVLIPLENWMYLPEKPGICQSSVNELIVNIKSLKENNPDYFIVVILHWGVEFANGPTIYQQKDAHKLIDAGADAIIGHHPHVTQNEEIYKDKPIFYSLGNFIFDQQYPAARKGIVASLTFHPNHSIDYKKYPVNIINCRPTIDYVNLHRKPTLNF